MSPQNGELKVLSLFEVKQQIRKSPIKGNLKNYSLHQISPTSFGSKKLLGQEKQTRNVANIKIVSKQLIKSSLQSLNLFGHLQSFSQLKYALSLIQEQAAKWKSLKHRHILRFYDCIETNKELFFFSQYSDGITLKKYISSNKLSFTQCLQIMRQLIQAVVYLHSKQIYNANISPENIFCSLYEPTVFKIGELEMTFSLLSEISDLTCKAPQYLLNRNGSKKADVWSLGVLLYFLLFQQLPWKVNITHTTKMFSQTDMQHLPKYPPNSNKPPSITYLVNDMLEYSQDKRISINDLRQEFLKLYFTYSRR